jgi:uncharacterized protein YebE (UPF0316 family)
VKGVERPPKNQVSLARCIVYVVTGGLVVAEVDEAAKLYVEAVGPIAVG